MQKKVNKQWHGYLLGFILPVLTFLAIYVSLAGGYTFSNFIRYLNFKGDLSRALSLAVIPNLGLFFAFIWTNRLKAAQGVLGITIILAFTIVLLRFI